MIILKKPEEIELMQQGGKKLRKIVQKLKPIIKPGITTNHIDQEAEKLIKEEGGESSFKKVPGYHWSTCLPVNEEIVHTPPSERILKEGDIITLDIGIYYKGFHTDFADTYTIGKTPQAKRDFLDVGKGALYEAIKEVKLGNRLGQVSKTIEKAITGKRYAIVKELTGHGIGRDLHEDPYVLGFLDRKIEKTPRIENGLVIAVEIIYSMGKGAMMHDKKEEWSIKTVDGSLSACFEHTVAVMNGHTTVLT
ncbi:type I methionyl aminopeptidase [Candidatus Roizmanbacteria bacterium RIFCSPHIGHO2_02_FULL_39_9]|uniref:Methionine aminopeptidase n=2 Tax=Candidatus Roizmaniibacteriota TaxID=1752723 RepID=A0A1F7HUV7_9BACT|nr:MAG: type I methionyl aminopeptidase [Candidatus Roizmanbacteria bacterium RIFCSPHIGHO2_02_FULL_39_9]OGK34920.1 MAG: type I methionyl aminopeptidase [Candidatus Roizmanbacteria bacterium RIFCSPHIGHO2_12_FULL_39_8]